MKAGTPRDAVLRDGRVVHLRALTADDEAELLQAFARLSSEERYMRFMASIRNPDVARLRAVLASFPQKGLAIGAIVPAADGIDIAGTASLICGDAQDCEFAISVTHGWAGAGLGGVLMDALIDSARARGLVRMVGYVFASNQPMLKLAARLGFTTAPAPGDYSLRIVTLEL